jgi:hypothetical protein
VAKSSPVKKSPAKKSGGRPAGLFTWIAVGLVVIIVATIVIIKVSSGPASTGQGGYQAADAATLAQVTHVPSSVFDAVGVNSAVAPVTPPIVLKGQPAFTGTSSTGATLPEVFYLGAEYCPYCAAQRWSTIVALSRFGTWKGLGNTTSSSIDQFPNTPTFTFYKSSFSSKYLVFQGVERQTNVFNSALNNYTPLENPTKAEFANFKKYDTSKFIPGITAQQNGSIPYMSIGNRYIVSGASFTPALLQNQTRGAIAAGLANASSPITAAIITSANYQTATFCVLTKNLPANVCTSAGVLAAKKAMGIK